MADVLEALIGEPRVYGAQALTFITIILACGSWAFTFQRLKGRRLLRSLIIPSILWFFFGTLDILVTVKGTYGNPALEANPLARYSFAAFGPQVTAFIWISVWAVVLLLLDHGVSPISKRLSKFILLTVLYSLAVGHMYALSGWVGLDTVHDFGFAMNQRSQVLNHMIFGVFYVSWVLEAGIISAFQMLCERKRKA